MSAAHSAVAVLSSRLEPYLNRFSFFFFFNDTATTEIYTLSLHDALPIYRQQTSDGHGGDEAQPEAPPRPGQDRVVHRVRLPHHGPPADHEGHDRFPQPRREPQLHAWLPRGEERGGERRRADRHLAPAGDGGERPRPLHGLADEAEIVDGAG